MVSEGNLLSLICRLYQNWRPRTASDRAGGRERGGTTGVSPHWPNLSPISPVDGLSDLPCCWCRLLWTISAHSLIRCLHVQVQTSDFTETPPPPLSAFVRMRLDPPSVRTSFMDDPIVINPVVGCQYFPSGYFPSQRASPPIDRYQIILLGDRGTRVWTTCPRLLPDSALARSRSKSIPGPFGYQSGPLPLHYQATGWKYVISAASSAWLTNYSWQSNLVPLVTKILLLWQVHQQRLLQILEILVVSTSVKLAHHSNRSLYNPYQNKQISHNLYEE